MLVIFRRHTALDRNLGEIAIQPMKLVMHRMTKVQQMQMEMQKKMSSFMNPGDILRWSRYATTIHKKSPPQENERHPPPMPERQAVKQAVQRASE
jgi:hypothetical protein